MLRLVLPLFFLASVSLAQPATVAGTLTGADGEPIPVAHAHVVEGDSFAVSVSVAPDGRFTLPVEPAGDVVHVRFTGSQHCELGLPMHLDEGTTVEVDVRLAKLPLAVDPSEVRVQHDGLGAGQMLEPHADGTFSETFAARADTFAYQLSGVTGDDRLVPGTAWDRLARADDGSYLAVLDVPGDSVVVTFEPLHMSCSDATRAVTFHDPEGRAARTAAVLRSSARRWDLIYQSRLRAHQSTAGASDEERAAAFARAVAPFELGKEQARLASAITDEADPAVRQALLLNYVSVETDLDAKDAALGLRALEEIGPAGRLWGLHPSLVQRALDLATRADSAATAAWARVLIQQHPEPAVRAYAILQRLDAADRAGDEAAAQEYYTLLQDEAHAETEAGFVASTLFARYDPDGAVAVGARVPDFSLPLLDGEGEVSRERLLGRVYLIDFWAVWCLPCIEEMPTLHAAYERFQDEGFEIVSLSFDDSPDQVRAFRAAHFPMPWLNAHVESGLTGDLAERFEVRGLPKPILVGPDGRILALSSGELRGALLERTLERIYGVED